MKIRLSLSNKWIQLFLWVPFFKPSYLSEYYYADLLFDLWKVISSLCVLVLIITKPRKGISKISCLIIFYQTYVFINTLMHGQIVIRDIVMDTIPTLCICILLDVCICICIDEAFNEIENIGIVLMFVNLCLMILNPGGLHDSTGSYYLWLLGYKNYQIVYIWPFTIIALVIKDRLGKWRIKEIIVCLLAVMTCIYNTSTTSLLAITLIIVIGVLYKKRGLIISIWTVLLMSAVANIAIVCFSAQYLFRGVIENILGKSVTLTGREYLWNRYLELVMEKPVFGYGKLTSTDRFNLTGINWAYHAHNQMLELMFQGGMVNVFIFAVLLIVVAMRLHNYRKFETSKLFTGFIFALLVLLIADVYSDTIVIFFTLVICYHVRILAQTESTYIIK